MIASSKAESGKHVKKAMGKRKDVLAAENVAMAQELAILRAMAGQLPSRS